MRCNRTSLQESSILTIDFTLVMKPENTTQTKAQIDGYINQQTSEKRADMQKLHKLILNTNPACKLWFMDGKNSEGKVVSNPNIGYGECNIIYADGTSRPFYQIGLSANTTGISIYIFGKNNKTYLSETFGKTLGKATVTGYCIKFKTLKDIHLITLKTLIQYGFEHE